MPKKDKKTKVIKHKAPVKKAKPAAGGMSSALKKAASSVVKKVGGAIAPRAKRLAEAKPTKVAAPGKVAKKPVAPPVKAAAKAPAERAAKAVKKVEAPVGKGKAAPALAPAPVAAKAGKIVGKGKGKAEVVVEVPAAKGVALLTREGKKKGKGEGSSVSKKNRCREPGCESEILVHGFCRLHYIKNWRKIKRKEAILASGQLNNYVEELVNKYPDKYLDVIRLDLATEKEWGKVVVDLELDSGVDDGGEEDMEGVAENSGRREREFDDDNESF